MGSQAVEEQEYISPEPFFSFYKVFWWWVYTMMLIGFAACWVFVNTQVLGNSSGERERFPLYEQE
jgi:hypothetical protein